MIISAIEHITKHTDTTVQVNIHSLLPLVPTLLTTYIQPVVPAALVNKLDTMPEPAAADTTIYAQLLQSMRKVMAALLVAHYAPRNAVSMNAQGLTRRESETDKSAYRYQNTAFVQSYMTAAYAALEAFLQLCVDNEDDITEWKNSPEKVKYTNMLVRSGTQLNSIYTFMHPQIMYRQLLTDMKDVEYIVFMQLFGNNYQVLKDKATPSDDEKTLLELLQKALVYLAYSRYIPKSSLSIDVEGIHAATADDQYDKAAVQASERKVQALQNMIDATGKEYLNMAQTLFAKIAADNSGYSVPERAASARQIDNSAAKGSYML